MARPRIDIALGSGSARGWSHIGVLEALHNAGIHPEIVCGSSNGALVGAAYVAGQLPALKVFALELTWRNIVGLLDVRLSGGGLISGEQIVALLQKLNIAAKIEGYGKAFAAIATDLATGRKIWLREGPIEDAVRASISLPGIFSPVRHGECWLVDGGCSIRCRSRPAARSAPTLSSRSISMAISSSRSKAARAWCGVIIPPDFFQRLLSQDHLGLRDQVSVIAARLLRPAEASPGYFDVLANSINIMQDQIMRSRLAGEPPHVMLVPRLRAND